MELLNTIWDLVVVGSLLYVVRKFFGEKLYDLLTKSERRQTIWDHYVDQGRFNGHDGEYIDCQQGKCAIN